MHYTVGDDMALRHLFLSCSYWIYFIRLALLHAIEVPALCHNRLQIQRGKLLIAYRRSF